MLSLTSFWPFAKPCPYAFLPFTNDHYKTCSTGRQKRRPSWFVLLKSGSPMLMNCERVILGISASLLDFHCFGKYQSILGVPALRCILSVYPMTVVYHSIRLSSHVPLFLPLMNIASYLFVLFFCSHASVRFIVRTCGGVTPLDSGPGEGARRADVCSLLFLRMHSRRDLIRKCVASIYF